MAIAVIGYAGAGKGTLCRIMAHAMGLPSISSSKFALDLFLFETITDPSGSYRLHYNNPSECFKDRINHREAWYNIIADYVKDDPTRMGRQLLAEYPVYDGIRSRIEFEALKKAGIIRKTVWVDAGDRVPPEPHTSMQLTAEDADLVVANDGTQLKDLEDLLESCPETPRLEFYSSIGVELQHLANEALMGLEYTFCNETSLLLGLLINNDLMTHVCTHCPDGLLWSKPASQFFVQHTRKV